mgnify:FL=1|jgi:hypothetical protein
MGYLRPVCVTCKCEMSCKKNSFVVAINKSPKDFVSGDCYECKGCGFKVVTGFARDKTPGANLTAPQYEVWLRAVKNPDNGLTLDT